MSNLPNIEASVVLEKITAKLANSIREVATYETLVDVLLEQDGQKSAQIVELESTIAALQADNSVVSGETLSGEEVAE